MFNLTAAVISVTITATVGLSLAPSPQWATVPYGMQFLAVMLITYPASILMKYLGRYIGFNIGCFCLMLSGIIGYISLQHSSFIGLNIAQFLLGSYIGFANFYRFAALDNLDKDKKNKAVSIVVSGGIGAAILGPIISMKLSYIVNYKPFAFCYLSFCVLSIVSFFIIQFCKKNLHINKNIKLYNSNFSIEKLDKNRIIIIIIAIFSSSISYLLMNLIMIQSSILMKNCNINFTLSSIAIQGHVIAMFLPSLFTTLILNKLGYFRTLVTGFFLLMVTTILGSFFSDYFFVFVSLLFLGIGWNFSYIGGGSLLSSITSINNQHSLQGINDTIIAIAATIGAFSPGILEEIIGWNYTNIFCFVLILIGLIINIIGHFSYGNK